MRQRRLTAVLSLITMVSAVLLASPAQAASLDYIALGDSYSSGVGVSDASGFCLRSPQGYPQLWADAHAVSSFRTAACSGAVTADVRSQQVSALDSGTDAVTITIGGNDVGFANAMITCTLSSTSSCLAAVDRGREYARTTLPGDLDSTYADIRRLAPSAKVYVLGYPRLFEESTSCFGPSLTKRKAINQAADELSGIISGRVSAAGFTYIDVRSKFAGHGICSSTPWINAFNWSVKSFHPNATGYRSGYLAALTGVTG